MSVAVSRSDNLYLQKGEFESARKYRQSRTNGLVCNVRKNMQIHHSRRRAALFFFRELRVVTLLLLLLLRPPAVLKLREMGKQRLWEARTQLARVGETLHACLGRRGVAEMRAVRQPLRKWGPLMSPTSRVFYSALSSRVQQQCTPTTSLPLHSKHT